MSSKNLSQPNTIKDANRGMHPVTLLFVSAHVYNESVFVNVFTGPTLTKCSRLSVCTSTVYRLCTKFASLPLHKNISYHKSTNINLSMNKQKTVLECD